MRRTSLVASVIAIGLSVLAGGCGQQQLTGAGGTGQASKAQARCVTPKAAAPAHGLTVTERDNGKSFCVVTGTGIFVVLRGSPADLWRAIKPSSAALQPRPNGRLSLVVGATGGYFVASRLGKVTLTSARGPCHFRMGSAMPASTVRCGPRAFFRVTVVIRGKA
jgi:hypothetical protein